MENNSGRPEYRFDKINAYIAVFVLLFTFIIYRLTVAPTLSFWDCGEFIACSYILGIPHPPGSPLFIVLGRVFSVIPFAQDICFRVNMISVISSAFACMFGYLALVRIIKMWFKDENFTGWARIITYIGGVIGALFMAFADTYWANAVEAEVYGLSMMLMTMMLWMSLVYHQSDNQALRTKLILLVCFLAMLGVAIHLSTFLIMPIAAIFFILRKNSPLKPWLAICGFFIVELLAIIVFADTNNGYDTFLFVSVIFLLLTAFLTYKYIHWPRLIAIMAFSLIMMGFYSFIYGVIGGLAALIVIGFVWKNTDWKTGIAIILVAVLGYSFHLFIPIRSQHNPRIDENNPSRDFNTFVNYLERKQYGSTSMVERMFERRALWSHQFGRHAHMGFWSYFEGQYGVQAIFALFFVLGLFGLYYTIMRNKRIGLPLLVLLLLASAGLVLYMNFADGIKYDRQTGDAYLEVRNRDYFFTPAYAYFGLALGLGIAALMDNVRRYTDQKKYKNLQKPILGVLSLSVFLPLTALAGNYYYNDHHDNYLPKIYSENILNTCEKDGILFTSGDNDTFPLWCVQEVYGHRKDVRVVNLSLFNTDWYVAQMKSDLYNVPISLDSSQIIWNEYVIRGRKIKRPEHPFRDKARNRTTYLVPLFYQPENRVVKLQDMMVDEVVISNSDPSYQNPPPNYPIYFSSEPYEQSPLNLRDSIISVGVLYKLDSMSQVTRIDAERGYDLYKNVYQFDGMNDPTLVRDENAAGVLLTTGFNAIRIADAFNRQGDSARADEFLKFIIEKYPTFYLANKALSDNYKNRGQTEKADSVLAAYEEYMEMMTDLNEESQFYLSDYGLVKHDRGILNNDSERVEKGRALLWEAFNMNRSNSYAYRKLAQALFETQRGGDLYRATQLYTDYKNNISDPMAQEILGLSRSAPQPGQPPGR